MVSESMKRFLLALCLCFAASELLANPSPTGELLLRWKVDSKPRVGLVYVPVCALDQPTPVIFAWHGHGGTMKHAAETFGYHKLWPEAICVYLQGLKTPGRLTDPEGKKTGWQGRAGEQEDRDLKLFDTVLAQLRRDYKIDDRRIYSTGHSNGGGFTYLLWAERGDVFAAVAPSSAILPPAATGRIDFSRLKPKPVLHVAGQADPLVKFAWQSLLIQRLREVNQCGEARPWGDSDLCTEYTSSIGSPTITYIHPGGHKFPEAAPALIVKFFKEQVRPEFGSVP